MAKEKTELRLKRLLDQLHTLNVKRSKCVTNIARAKRSLIERCNYVGIIYISRFLDSFKRDTLFIRFLERYPEEYLFVLAFADSESDSYRQAEEIADMAYEQNINDIREETDKVQDEHLCSFLSEYSAKEDLEWVLNLIEKKDWFRSYKDATSKMIQIENSSI